VYVSLGGTHPSASFWRVFGFHPVNLAFRFILEIAALIALGVGAYNVVSGPFAWVLAIAVPTIAAVAWAAFNVPGDESRSGEAPVAVPGTVRLIIELTVFASAVVVVSFASPIAAALLGVAVAIHYLLSIDRVRWLITH
jgi:hypothetical protein